jgi:hypothetical protein
MRERVGSMADLCDLDEGDEFDMDEEEEEDMVSSHGLLFVVSDDPCLSLPLMNHWTAMNHTPRGGGGK